MTWNTNTIESNTKHLQLKIFKNNRKLDLSDAKNKQP